VKIQFSDPAEFVDELKTGGRPDVEPGEIAIVRGTRRFARAGSLPLIGAAYVASFARYSRPPGHPPIAIVFELRRDCGELWNIAEPDAKTNARLEAAEKIVRDGVESLGYELRAGMIVDDEPAAAAPAPVMTPRRSSGEGWAPR
jgi:hypothetical protein